MNVEEMNAALAFYLGMCFRLLTAPDVRKGLALAMQMDERYSHQVKALRDELQRVLDDAEKAFTS